MKFTPLIALLLGFVVHCSQLKAQDPYMDSLKKVANSSAADTARIQALNTLAFRMMFLNADTGVLLTQQALVLAEKAGNQRHLGNTHSAMGVCYMQQGMYDSALAHLFIARDIREKIPGQKGLSGAIANIGLVYWRKGDFPHALENYLTALRLDEAAGDQASMAVDYGNIGNIYENQGDRDKGFEYYSKALHLDSVLDRKAGIAAMHGNIGLIWFARGNSSKALECFQLAYSIDSALGNDNAVARHLGNSGDIYLERGDSAKTAISRDSNYTAAYNCFSRALALDRVTGDQQQQVFWLTKLGTLSMRRSEFSEAGKYLEEARTIGAVVNDLQARYKAEEQSALYFAATNDWKNAYEHAQLAADLRSQLFNDEKSQALGRAEAEAAYDIQKALDDASHQKEIELAEIEKKKQNIAIILVAVVAIAAFVIAFVVFRSLKTARRQKGVIEKQKLLVEEKNKEIVDSINYARRLQEGILPPEKFWNAQLPDSFILYKPKDIVAGDFYWMESVGDILLFAVADCTGHGVPGAMVSVICSTALSRAVNEFNLTDPGPILDKAREIVLSTFEKSEYAVNDGMDIALCSLNRKTNELKFAGAYNPAWIISSNGLEELKANKQPVGKSGEYISFTTHTHTLQKGDLLYLFTDGYADQFGGPQGKKFKYKSLKAKLQEIAHEPMSSQKISLDETNSRWKGELEQVDDICVVGIRL